MFTRILLVPIAILGLIALTLAIWSGLDGDWWPLVVCSVGVTVLGGFFIYLEFRVQL